MNKIKNELIRQLEINKYLSNQERQARNQMLYLGAVLGMIAGAILYFIR